MISGSNSCGFLFGSGLLQDMKDNPEFCSELLQYLTDNNITEIGTFKIGDRVIIGFPHTQTKAGCYAMLSMGTGSDKADGRYIDVPSPYKML